jgi:Flp pilus assembly protein TadB
MEIFADYINLAIMHLPEIDILGTIIITLSIVILAALSMRYARRREKMKELKRQRKMLTARLDELAGGRKRLRL